MSSARLPSRYRLLVRCRSWLCALPLDAVVETLRTRSLHPVAGTPPFVLGLARWRGELVPVLDLATLLGDGNDAPGRRLVVVRCEQRRLALAVDEVLRVLPQEPTAPAAVAPLLGRALPAQVAALTQLDGEALALLQSTHLLPEELWATLAQQALLNS